MENLTDVPYVAPKKSTGPIILFSLIFFILGFGVGFLSYQYLFQALSDSRTSIKPQISCTPRPACLDATPRCMIPETADMCPPSTPTNAGLQIYKDSQNRYQISIPAGWIQMESGDFPDNKQFQALDESILSVNILESNVNSLTEFLAKQDESDKTSWEGLPGKKVISTSKTTVIGLPAIERVEEWSAAGFKVMSTYVLVNNTVYGFNVLPGSDGDYQKSIVYSNYRTVINTFEPLSPMTDFICPENGWQDCMPILDEAGKKACSSEAFAWYKANCPGFQGGAL